MADTPKRAKSSKKNRKHGRNKNHCASYRLTHRREKNKAKKLLKHLKRQPGDVIAETALKRCYLIIANKLDKVEAI